MYTFALNKSYFCPRTFISIQDMSLFASEVIWTQIRFPDMPVNAFSDIGFSALPSAIVCVNSLQTMLRRPIYWFLRYTKHQEFRSVRIRRIEFSSILFGKKKEDPKRVHLLVYGFIWSGKLEYKQENLRKTPVFLITVLVSLSQKICICMVCVYVYVCTSV